MNSERLKMADVIRQWIASVWDSGEGFPADDGEFYEAFIFWGIYDQSSPLMDTPVYDDAGREMYGKPATAYSAASYTVAWRGVQDD